MKKWFLRIALALGALSLVALIGIYLGFRASLPDLDGTIISSNITGSVKLERDINGNATITAKTREDLSYASGFLHAQERFFQMDLSRRMASGELSELFGGLAVEADKENRFHRFRHRAKIAYDLLSHEEQLILEKYTQGVNDGLAALGSKPFEYWLLGAEPKSWVVEDSFLSIYAMFFTLQSSRGGFEWQNHLMRQSLPAELADFLLPDRTEWDAPLQEDAEPYVAADIPSAMLLANATAVTIKRDDTPMVGSNNWAVSGEITETGVGMVSNDMHLTIRAPSIWYKLRLKLDDASLDITGASLPGAPAIVVGSNGSVAWGFTNSNIDTSDIIELKINPNNENQYLTKDGYQNFVSFEETIDVSGLDAEKYTIKETIWGPVMEKGDGKQYAYRWVAHMPDGVNLTLMKMEQTKSVHEVFSFAGDMGIPAQNAMIVDKDGNAAWTIFGKIPNRSKGNYRRVMDWSDGELEWYDWHSADKQPTVINPEHNRLWTANARVVTGDDLNLVGVSRYDLGARAKQIKDRMMALNAPVKEQDLYDIMLDHEAVFLDRWQKLLLDILENTEDEAFKPFHESIKNWGGQANVNSVGYRLVREYRDQVFASLMGHAVSGCVAYDEACDYDSATRQWEAPLWQLVTARPNGWLPGDGNDWQFYFEQQAFEAWKPVMLNEIAINDYTWGSRNVAQIAHPLSRAVPLLAKLTDMPADEQSGDSENMPHIAGRTKGQSERMVVSPGFEENGFLDLPAGQSGHPLSPYYGAGHNDWMEGKMTPFLPLETHWTLNFEPESQ